MIDDYGYEGGLKISKKFLFETFLRVGKIKTHNKLSVECSPFKTKKKYSKLSRKTYLSSIINKTSPLFGEKAKKNKQLPSLPPKKNKVTLVIYFCEKTLPLFGKKVKKNTQLPPPSPRKKFFFPLAPPLSKCRRGPWLLYFSFLNFADNRCD